MQQLCNKLSLDILIGASLGILRRGVLAAFYADRAFGAIFSFSPLLRGFGEDEGVGEDARGRRVGTSGRNREEGGGGGGAWRVFRAGVRDK